MLKLTIIARAGADRFARFETWLAYLAGFILILMGVTICYEVIARYVFDAPTLWSFELNMNLLLYFSLLGGAYTLLTDGHVSVDILYNRFPAKRKATIDAVIFLLALFFIAVLIWKGLEMALYSLEVGQRSLQILAWPLFPLQIMIPIGSALMGLQMIIRIVRDIHFVLSTRSMPGDS